jgi:hypothetical protein
MLKEAIASREGMTPALKVRFADWLTAFQAEASK